MDYIRKTYGLDVKRGDRVEYTGAPELRVGTVIGAASGRLRIRMDGGSIVGYYHPTWELKVLPRATDTAPGAPKGDAL
jgi:hypothetical protein